MILAVQVVKVYSIFSRLNSTEIHGFDRQNSTEIYDFGRPSRIGIQYF